MYLKINKVNNNKNQQDICSSKEFYVSAAKNASMKDIRC